MKNTIRHIRQNDNKAQNLYNYYIDQDYHMKKNYFPHVYLDLNNMEDNYIQVV